MSMPGTNGVPVKFILSRLNVSIWFECTISKCQRSFCLICKDSCLHWSYVQFLGTHYNFCEARCPTMKAFSSFSTIGSTKILGCGNLGVCIQIFCSPDEVWVGVAVPHKWDWFNCSTVNWRELELDFAKYNQRQMEENLLSRKCETCETFSLS